MMGEAGPLVTMPPGVDVTVYDVMGAPPFEAGGANATPAWVLPASAPTIVGAPGTVAGVTLFGLLLTPIFYWVARRLTARFRATPEGQGAGLLLESAAS